jgi:hypothetical protein
VYELSVSGYGYNVPEFDHRLSLMPQWWGFHFRPDLKTNSQGPRGLPGLPPGRAGKIDPTRGVLIVGIVAVATIGQGMGTLR